MKQQGLPIQVLPISVLQVSYNSVVIHQIRIPLRTIVLTHLVLHPLLDLVQPQYPIYCHTCQNLLFYCIIVFLSIHS